MPRIFRDFLLLRRCLKYYVNNSFVVFVFLAMHYERDALLLLLSSSSSSSSSSSLLFIATILSALKLYSCNMIRLFCASIGFQFIRIFQTFHFKILLSSSIIVHLQLALNQYRIICDTIVRNESYHLLVAI